MLLRVLIAGLIVFGGFAIAGWVIAPADWSGSVVRKGNRLGAPEPQAALAVAPPVSSEPAERTKLVPTMTFRPPDGGFNTALLTPGVTAVPAPLALASVPTVPPAQTERYDPRKPFRCPRGTPAASGPPTSAQIAQIEASLRLTPQQEKHWRPVQRALAEIAKHFENPAADPRRAKTLLSVERMQQIYWSAGPLVMSLRDDQKRDARRLACGMGLAAVAALI